MSFGFLFGVLFIFWLLYYLLRSKKLKTNCLSCGVQLEIEDYGVWQCPNCENFLAYFKDDSGTDQFVKVKKTKGTCPNCFKRVTMPEYGIFMCSKCNFAFEVSGFDKVINFAEKILSPQATKKNKKEQDSTALDSKPVTIIYTNSYHDGFARVYLSNGRYGFIDGSGVQVSDQFDYIDDFKNGRAFGRINGKEFTLYANSLRSNCPQKKLHVRIAECDYCKASCEYEKPDFYLCPNCKELIYFGNHNESALITLVKLAKMVAKADGVIDEKEINVVRSFLTEDLSVDVGIHKYLASLFNKKEEEASSSVLIENSLHEFKQSCNNDEDLKLVCFELLVAIGTASNGKFHPKQEELIKITQRSFNINQHIYIEILERYAGATEKIDDYCKILGISLDVSIDGVKKRYRQLVMELHPDRLPPGTSATVIELAKKEFIKIQDAYKKVIQYKERN